PARGRDLLLRVVDADRPRTAPGQPGRDVARPAPEFDRVLALEVVREQVEFGLGDVPRAPRLVARPEPPRPLARLDEFGRPLVPGRPVALDVLGKRRGVAGAAHDGWLSICARWSRPLKST